MHPEFDLIDRVARAMTEADPPRDLRVRVTAKLPTARPSQPVWQYAAVAFGGLALGMLIMVSMKPASPAHTTSSAPAVPTSPVSIGRSTSGATPVSTGRPPGTRSSRPMTPIGPLGPVGPSEGAFQILSITPIQPSELSIAPIVVGPLGIAGSLTLPPVAGGGSRK